MITTYSAPVARLIRSASTCTGPPTPGREATRSSAMDGWAAVAAAMASARRIAWSSSWALSGARKSPVARTATPAAMASCMSSTWEKTRCGQPNRRRRGAAAVGGAVMSRHVRRPWQLPEIPSWSQCGLREQPIDQAKARPEPPGAARSRPEPPGAARGRPGLPVHRELAYPRLRRGQGGRRGLTGYRASPATAFPRSLTADLGFPTADLGFRGGRQARRRPSTAVF